VYDLLDLYSENYSKFIKNGSQLARKGKTLVDRLVAEFLSNGTSTDAQYKNFDDKPLFSEEHPRESLSNQSNLYTSLTLSEANLSTAYTNFISKTDPLGGALGDNVPTVMIAPRALEVTARKLIENQFNAAGENNIWYKKFELIVLPELDAYSTTRWYLASKPGGNMPFATHTLIPVRTSMVTDINDSFVLLNDKVLFGADAALSLRAGAWMCLAAHGT
jgi:phage major head subunit gpT-like protein